jgi:hypothetical protein
MAEADDDDGALVLRHTTTPMDVLKWASALTREGHPCHSFGENGSRELNCQLVYPDPETPPAIAAGLGVWFGRADRMDDQRRHSHFDFKFFFTMRALGAEHDEILLCIIGAGPLLEGIDAHLHRGKICLNTPNKLANYLESDDWKVWFDALNDPSMRFDVTRHYTFGTKIVPMSQGVTVKSAGKA